MTECGAMTRRGERKRGKFMLLESARILTQKKLAAAALAGLLSAGALTAAGQAAQAQTQEDGGEVVNRDVVVNEDRDYTGLWGLLGLLGLAGLAGLRRKKDDVDVRRAPSAERGSSTGGNSSTSGSDVKGETVRDSGTRNVTSADGDGVRRGTVRDSEVVSSTEDGSVDGDKVNVHRKR